MNEHNFQENWQVDVGGQIYESNFDELTKWIDEGSLLPQDFVKRGNLRWIEARKVPSLFPFFNAKEKGLPPPVVTTSMNSAEKHPFAVNTNSFQNSPNVNSGQFTEFNNFTKSLERVNHTVELPPAEPQIAENCCIHDQDPAAYLCETCGNSFCRACVKSYGGNVKICPMCGAMCKSAKEIQTAQIAVLPSYAGEGFGFGDFGRAIVHPFKFKTSLFLGAFMFSIFTVGQATTGFGGVFMLGAALFCYMLANMMTFGVLKNTIDNFSQGKLEVNFMPSFDDFSLWDDVIHPFFLSIAAYIVSFGLFLAIVAGGVWWTFSSISEAVPQGMTTAQPFNQADVNSVKQVDNFKDFANDMNERNQTFDPNNPQNFADTEEDVRQAQEMINQHRKTQVESTFGKAPETVEAEQKALVTGMVTKALPLVLLAGLAFLWGLFYFPAACAVAGYTQTFSATINPLVGLDTIKTFGLDYVKILLMGFILVMFSGFLSFFIGLMLSPFNLPKMGNIPAQFISGFITFYISTVFSCLLGYAIFKNADKFKLTRS